MESPPEQPEKASEVRWGSHHSIQEYTKEISTSVPHARRIHTWSTVMSQVELKKEKSQFFPNLFSNFLQVGRVLFLARGLTQVMAHTISFPYFPLLLGIFNDNFSDRGALLEASERDVKSTHTKSLAAAPCPTWWVHLTPRPGLWKINVWGTASSRSFGLLLCSLHNDVKSLILLAWEHTKCRQDSREQCPLYSLFGNQQAL